RRGPRAGEEIPHRHSGRAQVMSTLTKLLLAALLLVAPWASAHEMTIAEMEMRETAPGEFIWQWYASSDKRPVDEDLAPRWPEGCVADDNALHCGARGLTGSLSVDGVGKRYSAALVRIYWHDGEVRVYTLTSSQPRVELFGSSEDRRPWYQIASAYTVL